MDSFQWDKNFATGIDDVDFQHKKLVDLINRFGHQLASDELVMEDINQVLQELWLYTQEHFQDEERLMHKKGIDPRHLTMQKQAHRYFLHEVQQMQASISIDQPDALKYLLDFLTQWLAYHILGDDKNMARQIEAIDAGMSPQEAFAKEESQADNATAPLLTALNGLFNQVSQRNKQLIDLNQTLEEKVRLRTQALSDANTHLEKLSITDMLTGLANRRFAMEKLTQLWHKPDSSLGCIMIDADHFKTVNDTYGHDAGDLVLCRLAKVLEHAVRTDDFVCRLGGDEFLILCPETDLAGLQYIADQLLTKVNAILVTFGANKSNLNLNGHWRGSVSIGLAVRTPDMMQQTELLKQADQALYLAKEAGKNCIRTETAIAC
ncbi:GGDEF domain-containing protein [Shewanella nanhaiensis]|uniref:diguanylate cyclase n=1 Tax=Shewanella nanhaiensis TaxID=2864872 RepID=A0ABS7E3M7_9GAMM|nr:GGDEF domain-containing protein [Shewanella nanhaiensis]MBW8184301.1 GGDEF domain-containing protein [Shewanella nanhaiensis]